MTITNSADRTSLEATLAVDDNGMKTDQIVFENSFEPIPRLGSLRISKVVSGKYGDKSKFFSFTVTLSRDGSYSYSGSANGTIRSGQSIQLKHGDSILITGLPASTEYSVTESGNAGYMVYVNGGQGIIQENETSTAIFINTRGETPKTGDSSRPVLWLCLMTAAFAGCAGILLVMKRLDKNR